MSETASSRGSNAKCVPLSFIARLLNYAYTLLCLYFLASKSRGGLLSLQYSLAVILYSRMPIPHTQLVADKTTHCEEALQIEYSEFYFVTESETQFLESPVCGNRNGTFL